MLRLIKLDLRLRICSRLFLLLCGGLLLTSLAVSMEFRSGVYHLNPIPFSAAAVASMLSAVFGIGTDFADGTVRNKLVSGNTKLRFYLSQLIASLCIGLIFFLLAGVPYFLIGHNSFFSRFSREILVRAAVLLLAFVLFLTVIAVFISVFVKNRAAAVIVCIGAVMVLSFTGNGMSRSLLRPEYTKIESSSESGQVNEKIVPNERYVSGSARTVLYTAFKLNPYPCLSSARGLVRSEGDINRTSLEAIERECEQVEKSDQKYVWDPAFYRDTLIGSIRYPIWSGSFMLVLTAAGAVLFRKRNIN